MRVLATAVAVPLALFVVLAFAPSPRSPQADPEAERWIERMLEAYSTCDTYRDEGEVRTVFRPDDGRDRTVLKPFETLFARPDRLLFEFRDRRGEEEWDRYVIWDDGQRARSWWTLKGETREFDDLERALAAASGVSSGSSSRIPSLLLPHTSWGGGLRQLSEARVAGREPVDGAPCVRIEALRGDRPLTLWIDEHTGLLRRCHETRELDTTRTETTTTYRPEVGATIDPATFGFEPPR